MGRVPVAPLAGSVDRNKDLTEIQKQQALLSLPSRGAWIEITIMTSLPST